jgi:hypothetical protein
MFNTNDYYINFPDKAIIWIVWGFLLMGFLISGFLIRKPGRKLARINLIWLAILSILLPITSLFGGISLKISDAISININILNAIPWFLAAGLSGVLPSLILAFTAGLLTSLSASHSILTPLVFTAIALLFNILIGVRKHELSEAPALSPIKATLWTLLTILGIAGVGIVLLLTTSQNAILTAFSFTLIKEVLSLLLAVLIAGVLSQLAAVFLKYFWTPLKLQKPRYSTKKINRTLVFAHSLANGADPPSEQQLKKHGPLGELNRSLKNIKQKLNTKYASQSYVRMLDSVFLDEISLEKLLQQILIGKNFM